MQPAVLLQLALYRLLGHALAQLPHDPIVGLINQLLPEENHVFNALLEAFLVIKKLESC